MTPQLGKIIGVSGMRAHVLLTNPAQKSSYHLSSAMVPKHNNTLPPLLGVFLNTIIRIPSLHGVLELGN
jgi:hypothetical protein